MLELVIRAGSAHRKCLPEPAGSAPDEGSHVRPATALQWPTTRAGTDLRFSFRNGEKAADASAQMNTSYRH
ncbi:hypothetical protein [Nitrosomonas communis]|uniref:hypothetical protein n=1 Tax=Nitrosomonas communis TaxID=44574 RepID=UPI0011608B9C|nr:hypothetical protein [Nitrosomonas communis]